MLKKNQTAEVYIDGCTPEGYGVCRLDGRAVFVSDALRGERCEVLILKVTNHAVWAKCLRILEASPERLEADCPHLCGGCTLRNMTYEEELRVKKEHVDDCLRRIGGQNKCSLNIHPSPSISRYRNKAIFAVDTAEGKTAFGFYRPRSHKLVPVEDCLLQSEVCLRAAHAVAAFLNVYRIPAYNEQTCKGVIRHLFWRESGLGDRVICIVAARGFGNLTNELVNWLRREIPELTGIVLNINKTKGNTVLTGDFYTLWGNPCVRESLCGNVFEIAPQAFLQINPAQAELLYAKALEFAGKGELCLDLYCGAGTVTLALAGQFNRVIGAEIVPEAVENAAQNAICNGVKNTEFICADAAEAAERFNSDRVRPDVIVVDPPRKGLAESVVNDIAAMVPDRVVYISCNPATLARDLRRFEEKGYVLEKAEAYDMFPRCPHVESVVKFTRAGL